MDDQDPRSIWLGRQTRRRAASARPERLLSLVERELLHSFQWRDSFLVGHAAIDDDHKRFFTFFSDLALCIDAAVDTAALMALFLDLVKDLDRHLAEEERILGEIGFPGLAGHQSCHRLLAERIGAAQTIGHTGQWVTALRLLATSVLEHIIEEDREIRHHLVSRQAPDSGTVRAPI